MAGIGDAVVSLVVKEVLRKLGSAIGEQIKARWNLGRDMEDMEGTLGIVQAVLRDAERRSVREEAVSLWLKMLKDAAYDISDMFDEFEDKLSKGKISSSVAKLTMGKRLKNMREKLSKVAAQRTQFAFKLDACSTDHEEIKKRQTTSKIDRATIVGRQKEKDDIITLLKSDDEQETLVLPIFGFAGIGKTTLARLVFNDDRMQYDQQIWVYVSPHFDLEMIGKSILSQIKQRVEGLDGLQSVSNCLEETLGGKSCLIVLDDLWESNCFNLAELRMMLSNFKNKSKIRIIVTTRTEKVARNIGTVAPIKLKPLSDDHCWTLFKKIAFQSGISSREDKNVLDEIGRDITKKCQGVPMAIQALGFMLRNKNAEEWKNVRDSDVWDGSSTSDMLPSLKLSYYQMTDYLKLCFSYCSVFPKGCEIHRVDLIQQWISLGFIPSSPGEQHLTLEKIGENYVNELIGMSFLQYSRLTSSITREDTTNSILLSMHDLIHDLGRSVLGDELFFMDGKKGCDSRSRNHRYALIANGAREIDFCNYVPTKLRSLHMLDSVEIDPSLYSKSLRVLDLSNFSSGNFPASIGKLNQLRYLRARGMQHKSVPKDVTSLSKLMYLDISGSSKISTLPKSVNNLRSLVHLDLSGCCNLCTLPESFGDLENVSHLNLANCSLLKALPESVNKLRSLIHLDLSGCCKLCLLPESFGDLQNLSHLNLANCSLLKALPESVSKLRTLLHLDLSGCCNLCSLPESFGNLENLSHLNLANCSLLKALPDSVNKLRSLLHLDLSGCCNLCSLPESFGDLTDLTDLNLGSCVLLNTLPDSVDKLRNLVRLDLSGCCYLCSLPESSGDLMNLSQLYLANCSLLKTLPESVHKLKSLQHLDLSGCSSLHSLPQSFGELMSLSHLNLAKCTDLRSLPKSFGRLCELQYLNLSDCLRLDLWFDIETVCCLTKLQYLNLSRCPSLMHIPESVNNLKDLHTLDLSRCHWIQIFPESLCGMASLKFLLIHECRPWLQQRVRESQFKNDDDVLTLPKFIVQRTASGTSSNISRLQSVYPAELEIVCLESVASIEEANSVNLADKSVLAKLVLAWTPAVERFVDDEALLRELRPPKSLMSLKVQGYMATSFPGWVMGIESCLLHLVGIEMVDLPRCEHLPPFGQLKNLQQLILKGMPILKKLGTEICGGSGAFKKLKEFTLGNLDILEEWVTKIPEDDEFMFPSLHKLEICHCPKLRLTPCLPRAFEWRIEASDEIIASQYYAGPSSSLTLSRLHVTSCHLLPSQWALLGFLPALEVLEISNYAEEKLPDWIDMLVSLRSLKIDVSTQDPEKQSDLLLFLISTILFGHLELAVLPKPQLTALENLEISFANNLQTWCSKKHGRWTLQKANDELAAFFERMLATMKWRKDECLSYIHQVKELAYALNSVGHNLRVRDEEVIRRIRKSSCT